MGRLPSDYAVNAVRCKLWGLVNDESPVEHILGVEIFRSLASLYDGCPCWIFSEFEFATFAESYNGPDRFVVVPQFSIPGVGHVDFAIFVPSIGTEKPLLVVEIDGHSNHSTPDQESEDRRRDRTLQRLGIPFLRFTGRDVVRCSEGVAQEVAAFVHTRWHELVAQQAHEADYNQLQNELDYARYGLP